MNNPQVSLKLAARCITFKYLWNFIQILWQIKTLKSSLACNEDGINAQGLNSLLYSQQKPNFHLCHYTSLSLVLFWHVRFYFLKLYIKTYHRLESAIPFYLHEKFWTINFVFLFGIFRTENSFRWHVCIGNGRSR